MRRVAILAVLATFALGAVAQASTTVSQSFNEGGHVSLTPSASGCENNPGPYITLSGALTLKGVNAKLIFTNNTHFTHVTSADVTADVEIIPEGSAITVVKQPSQGGVDGNPWIYLQFKDGKGNEVGGPELLGRCVQGLTKADKDFSIPSGVKATVTSGDCDNSGGPSISLNGELRLGGISADIILTNNAKFTHASGADVVIGIVIIPEGQSITFAKQPPQGGVGGNPIIYIEFTRKDGSVIGSPFRLGRCNQL